MNLLAPALLWTLAGLAVPIAIHLLGRGQRRVIPFSNVRWLVARPSLRGLRFAPSDAWLFVARAAMLALLALALAQPACRDRSDGAPSAPRTLEMTNETDVWGALREADRDLPPGQPLRLVGRPSVAALIGTRPALSRDVQLEEAGATTSVSGRNDGAPASASPTGTRAGAPLGFRIRWDGEPDPRVDRAVRSWLVGLAAAAGLEMREGTESALDLDIELVASADAARGPWIEAALEPPNAPMSFAVRSRGDAVPSPPSGSDGVVYARDGQGRALVTQGRRGGTRVVHFAVSLAPESTDLLRREAWVELGLTLLAPWSVASATVAPPTRLGSVESLRPRRAPSGVDAPTPQRWDRRATSVAWIVALLLFTAERALSWRRATTGRATDTPRPPEGTP
jgi:hypothetical protein